MVDARLDMVAVSPDMVGVSPDMVDVRPDMVDARLGKPRAYANKDGSAEVEAAKLLAALDAEQAEEVERSGAVSAFDEEPVRSRLTI